MNETEAVASPCTSVCRMSPDRGLCEGCLRTLDEIATWSRMENHEKRAVWLQLAQRRENLTTQERP
jgi:uncharacterized protein